VANLELDYREHPARAVHPVTGESLGVVHPAVADWLAVYLLCPEDTEDMFLGYITPNKKFHMTVPPSAVGGKDMAEMIRRRIADEQGLETHKGPTVGELPKPEQEDTFHEDEDDI
jgi:hypothetical protein